MSARYPSEWHTSHFDLLEDYDGEIPRHVAVYLNTVKTRMCAGAIRLHHPAASCGPLAGIDIGCGTGDHAMLLESLLPSAHIDGLDSSERQLAAAKAKGFPNRLIHAQMYDTALPDNSYDFVVAVNSLHHLPSRGAQAQTFSEFSRILRPGGLLLVHEISILNLFVRLYVRHVFPRTRGIDDGTELFLRRVPVGPAPFAVIEERRFTFVPDFTPRWLMPVAVRIDSLLSRAPLSRFGAHVMWVLVNRRSNEAESGI